MMSSLFACLWCSSGCSTRRLANSFAYFPPNPPTYSIVKGDKGELSLNLTMVPAGGINPKVTAMPTIIKTSRGEGIAVVLFKVANPTATILYSHGNAIDCGIMYMSWAELAATMNVDVCGYDYTGYGASTGKPSERNSYADITAVFEFLLAQGLNAEKDIIVYGQSLGSGPSTYLASNYKVRGLCLHSGLMTGIRVIAPDERLCAPANVFYPCDMYPNIRRITKVQCPVLIIHGNMDNVVDVNHGHALYDIIPEEFRYPPYFVEHAGHEDVFEVNPSEYFKRLRTFVRDTEEVHKRASPEMELTEYDFTSPRIALPEIQMQATGSNSIVTSTSTL